MPKIKVNGAELFYVEEGTGSPLILLHGLTVNHLIFSTEMEYLKENFRVIALDFRGHGKSERPLSYTLQDHIQDVISLMNELEIEKTSLLGASMGSYVAQGVAIAVPERVDKLILVAAKSHGKTSSMARLFAEHGKEVQGLSDEEQIHHLYQYAFHDLNAVSKWMDGMTDQFPILTTEQQTVANKALEGFDFRSDLYKVSADTLVISGKHDGLNLPEMGKEVSQLIPGAKFVEFELSGHMPSIEEPDRYMEILLGFLDKKDV